MTEEHIRHADIVVRKVKSAVRTVELLEYLAARPDDPARLREISDALDMPRSSAHALLRTLVAQGWVRSRRRPARCTASASGRCWSAPAIWTATRICR